MTSSVDFTGDLSPDEKMIEEIFKNYSKHAMQKLIEPLVALGLLDDDDNILGHTTLPEDNSTNIPYKISPQFEYALADIIQPNIISILKRHQQPMKKSDIITEIKKIKILADIDSDIIDPCMMKLFETMVTNEYIKIIDTKYYTVTY
jgi:hypothetical protein